MFKDKAFISTLFMSLFVLLIVVGMEAFPAWGATNTAYSRYNIKPHISPGINYQDLYAYTQSTSNPEAFSVAMPEFDSAGQYDYDEFKFVYQTSSVTGEWTWETVYIWLDMDGDDTPNSLQATLTGADANSPVYVEAID